MHCAWRSWRGRTYPTFPLLCSCTMLRFLLTQSRYRAARSTPHVDAVARSTTRRPGCTLGAFGAFVRRTRGSVLHSSCSAHFWAHSRASSSGLGVSSPSPLGSSSLREDHRGSSCSSLLVSLLRSLVSSCSPSSVMICFLLKWTKYICTRIQALGQL